MAVSDYSSQIQLASAQYGVPASLITAVMQQESGGVPGLIGTSGEIGLMQIMPSTAGLSASALQDPQTNIDAGTAYLATLLSEYNGNAATALAAYNWGPGNVNSGNPVPNVVQNYVNNVLAMAGTGTGTTGSTVSTTSGALVDLSGAAATTPTSDVLDQLSSMGIDLTDPTTDLVVIGSAALIGLFLIMR